MSLPNMRSACKYFTATVDISSYVPPCCFSVH